MQRRELAIERTAALTSSVSGAGAWKRAPPWTIRCPTDVDVVGQLAQQRASGRAAVARVAVDRGLPHRAPGAASAAPGSTS